jgi:hypothetical protein
MGCAVCALMGPITGKTPKTCHSLKQPSADIISSSSKANQVCSRWHRSVQQRGVPRWVVALVSAQMGPLEWQIQIHGSRRSSDQHTLSRFIATPDFSSSHNATLQIALQRAAQGDARMCDAW